VRARPLPGGGLEIAIDGVTTKARYYKPLIYEFFRTEMAIRPRYGDYQVHLRMEHVGAPPAMDLDNLCKALLDALKGFVFHDDSQIARLLAERAPGERDRIIVITAPLSDG
jgi:crossover junction endodeoxyribonuclease RusA